jgi:deoxycytidylate deaminase
MDPPCKKIGYFMQHAIELAKKSTMEMKHGCVIVNTKCRDKQIVATGINEHVLNCEERNVFSIHSEMKALANLIGIRGHNEKYLENCTAFVARVGSERLGYQVKMSRPCIKCQKLLKKMGIKRIFYTIDENSVAELKEWDAEI